jgi:hypothetical protein
MGLLGRLIEKIQPEKQEKTSVGTTTIAPIAPTPAAPGTPVLSPSTPTTTTDDAMSASSRNALKPAFVIKAKLAGASPLGVTPAGTTYTYFEFEKGGSIESAPGYEPAFKAELQSGADWFHVDNNGKYGRTEVRSVGKTDGGFVEIRCTGIMTMAEPILKIFGGAPDMATTPFGLITSHMTVTTGDAKLKELENRLFTSSTRFIVGETGVTAELVVSELSSPSD